MKVVPNPATGEVRIGWKGVDGDKDARLTIYDVLGREVAVLTPQTGGTLMTWDAAGLPGGRYYVTLSSGTHSTTAIVLLMR